MSDVDQRLSRLSPLRLALMAQELRSQRALVNAEPIAIIGMGCRFPGGADSPAALWRMLHDGVDFIREVPPERWDVNAFYDPDPDAPGKMYCKDGAFLSGIDQFDADFFGISPREAASMDPQQRLLLEVSWEALEHAGQSPERLAGSSTGVFVGINASDYLLLQMGWGDPGRFNDYTGMGNSHSVAVGRLSYLMGLRGPSMAVDTACSSSLLAVHLACQSLRNEECDLALAGGVNLVLVPEITVSCCRFRMLSPDGRCKTFDAAANGYVRGEGCGMIVLKRYSDALADGDHVLALVRGSAANQDGRSNGLTAPSGAAQQDVIRRALASSGVDPHQVGYLEAHGTGTPLGDPIEFDSMAAVLAADRAADNPLVVGSVKTNIGHLETAAGIAGLMKAVLALCHEEIPPHLNLKSLSPHISHRGDNVRVATELTPWRRSLARRRLAGVSSFGFSGTNVHAILEEAPVRERSAAPTGPQLLILSAQTATALTKLAAQFAEHFAQSDAGAFVDDCYTANNGRSRFKHRLALVADSPRQASAKLAAFAAGDGSAVLHGVVPDGVRPKASAELPGLESLAALFVQGVDVDLECAEDEERPRKTHLPTYPFERRRFWLEAAHRGAPADQDRGESASHPLLGRRMQSPLREIAYEARIGAQSPAYLSDHRVRDSILFPATGYIEMALAASLETHGAGSHTIENLAIADPLVLPSEGRVTVQCILTPEGRDEAAFR
ncbi:MAG TPA: beta-ketoacyl synthase N-terminal-like domain-containing protein, partial [Candidatus Acidoferrum sp.]|nr:beta-ketoacyl synthase N-terminal-like domain-containing protein [Candidatus Acidoferrum sp.]